MVKYCDDAIDVIRGGVVGKKIKSVRLEYSKELRRFDLSEITLHDGTKIEVWPEEDVVCFDIIDSKDQG